MRFPRLIGWCGSVVILIAGAAHADPAPAPDAATKVVGQGGVVITLGDVDTWMQRVPQEKRAGFIDSPKRIEDMLNNLLRVKQLAQQARDLRLDLGLDDNAKRESLAQDEELARLRLEKFKADIQVPDVTQLAREEYTAHKERYVVPDKVDVQDILISTEKRSVEDAQKLADTVRAQALASPGEFDALVDKYSEDRSRSGDHGRLEDATSSKYVPELRHAAGGLSDKASISPAFGSKFGYYVLKLLARQPGRQLAFEEVKDKLVATLRQQYVDNQRKDFLNQLSNQELDPNPEVLTTLRERYGPSPNDSSMQSSGQAPVAKGRE